jgi:hypothetical protein
MMLLRYLIQWWIFRRAHVQAAVAAYREAQAAVEAAAARRDTRRLHEAVERSRLAMINLLRSEQECKASWRWAA